VRQSLSKHYHTMFSMKHISKALFQNSLHTLPSDRIFKLLPTLQVSSSDIKLLYEHAWKSKNLITLNELSLNYGIKAEFKFLGEFYDQKIKAQEFQFLALPYFLTDRENFMTIVQKLTGPKYSKGILKKFGVQVEKYGVSFLNNYLELSPVMKKLNLTMDELMSLDHSHLLPKNLTDKIEGLDYILSRFSKGRAHILMSTADSDTTHELQIIAVSAARFSEEKIKNWLPRKPKSLKEIHDKLSEGILKETTKDVPLMQDIFHFHGQACGEFIIEVPEGSHDLVRTSTELKHCVHAYKDAIIKKNCQILNLIKDGQRIYTVELRKSEEKYFIWQFRGFQNENSMESSNGDELRKKLLELMEG
jgi:hypothetical protein